MQAHLLLLNTYIVLLPLIGSLIAGLLGKKIGRSGAHWVTILGMLGSFILSLIVFKLIVIDNVPAVNGTLYTWGVSGSYAFNLGFLIDKLTAVMLIVVTFISLMVHIYSVGYMKDDPGYQRFFSYMSLFTFAMLTLVSANNFLQLFFGWEGVGLVSYLLIGFWFNKESANLGSLKAFIVNRVGDLGFILALGAIIDNFNTLDYARVFELAPSFASYTIQILPGMHWSLLTVICILLFTGAMGKSAQMPLHVWLPESMEGPTPISALIHAATMVTAGIFMLTRMSPLFQYSTTALSMVLIIGATGALFTGLLAIVQHDIKRVVAYSTLSQLGYMIAACGAAAFSAGMFQLITHACFKALLFLAAGSVIIAMHHEQDMRKMGGLWRYLPITYITFLIGALSLSGIPPFAGFFSKDSVIEAVKLSAVPGAHYAYYCVLIGTFVTALYIFRAFFYTFHSKERFDTHTRKHIQESPWVVTLPLIILAIPSVILGAVMIYPILYQPNGLLGNAVVVPENLNVIKEMSLHYAGIEAMMRSSINSLPCWFAATGIFVAWLSYVAIPKIPRIFATQFKFTYQILLNKYGFDAFYQRVLVHGTQNIANFFFNVTDVKIIDGWMVNGTGQLINWMSRTARKLQTGYIYHYALVMIIGLLAFMWWMLL